MEILSVVLGPGELPGQADYSVEYPVTVIFEEGMNNKSDRIFCYGEEIADLLCGKMSGELSW